MGRTPPVVSKEYIVGLADGEGCFYVNIWKSPAYRAGYGVQMHFHLKLQEHDRALLESVKRTLGCGAVYLQKETRANHCQCYRYTVNSRRDILGILIPFFRAYPLQSASKRANFKLFCQIAHLVERGEHLTAGGVERIRTLKMQMNQRTTGLA